MAISPTQSYDPLGYTGYSPMGESPVPELNLAPGASVLDVTPSEVFTCSMNNADWEVEMKGGTSLPLSSNAGLDVQTDGSSLEVQLGAMSNIYGPVVAGGAASVEFDQDGSVSAQGQANLGLGAARPGVASAFAGVRSELGPEGLEVGVAASGSLGVKSVEVSVMAHAGSAAAACGAEVESIMAANDAATGQGQSASTNASASSTSTSSTASAGSPSSGDTSAPSQESKSDAQ